MYENNRAVDERHTAAKSYESADRKMVSSDGFNESSPSPVQEALNTLSNLTRDAHDALSSLLMRLGPVAGPCGKGESAGALTRGVGECKIEEIVMSQAESVRSLCLRIQEARDALRI